MRVNLGSQQRPVVLDRSTLIGKGGEKTIHRDPDSPRSKAIAIYHDPTSSRRGKIKAFLEGGFRPPDQVIAPREAAFDTRGRIVGFGMKQLGRRYQNLKNVFTPSFCEDHGITGRVIAETMLTVGENLASIHKNRMVVGDLNDGGIMIHTANHSIAWVDVDSWSIEGFPCIVGTKLYLSPELCGVDLSTGNYFAPHHDWFSYSVLLFRSLLRKHPFKAGRHAQWNNVVDRAKNGATVLDSEVVFPKVGLQPDMLSDDLADQLIKHLKLQDKGPFPLDQLRKYRDQLAECASCGTWYPTSRAHCPVCATTTAVDLSKMIGATATDLIETRGRIVHVQIDRLTVFVVAEELGKIVLYRKERDAPVVRADVGISYQSGMRFGVFAGNLVTCVDEGEDQEMSSLYILAVTPHGVQPVSKTSTEVLAGKAPVFATSRRYLYRLAQNMLLREEQFGESDLLARPVTQVFPNQCWFTVDPDPGLEAEVIFGLNRDVDKNFWFVARSDPEGSSFTTSNVDISALDQGESLKDLSVRFSKGTVLVIRKTQKRGLERVRLETVESDTGKVLTSEIVDLTQSPLWENVHGKAYHKGRVMHATDDGIVAEDLSGHTTVQLGGTMNLVAPDDQLLRFGKGILVTRHNRLTLVTN